MNYHFDEIIERRGTLARKWSKENLVKEFQTDDVLPMWIADMDIACPPPVVAAMKKVASQRIYGYTFVPDSYYQAVIDWNERRHHWRIRKNWITLTHGTVSTLHYIVQAFCQQGDKVITQTPGYQPFQRAVEHHECELLCNPLIYQDGSYELDLDDLEEKAKDPRAKMLIFCNPHNPTGRVWTAAELKSVAQICLKHNVLLVSDEIHKDIGLYGNSPRFISKRICRHCGSLYYLCFT
ncbi:aminotransferase class I/II-fold pyridoxal phosphate-dependent enzyme [Virgibacillus halophilus]|uniref:cysteine-S-conjugate beta-lyase n=1 Tax=Tigheibacillus halophilus TaxID=361280 RepID=A0ABU5C3A3_9BACI|nr:aminotransferase class I/II-fold pyridoxal phosphate-dependent enzyme [Virgibacillus halophilus]